MLAMQEDEKGFYRKIFQRYLRPQMAQLFLLGLLLLLSSVVVLAPAQILRFYIDAAQQKNMLTILLLMAVLYLVSVIIAMGVNVWSTYLSERLSWSATNMLRADLMQHCLDLDMSFHNAHMPGELIERIDGDVNTLANFFSQLILQVLNNAILLVCTLVLLTLTDWRLGIVFSLFAVVTLFAMGKVRNIAIPHWKVARQASAHFFGFLEERLNGREDILSSSATNYVMHRFYQALQQSYKLEKKAGLMGSTLGATTVICFTLGYVMAFSLGTYLYQQGAITLGGIYLLYQYMLLLERPVQQITTQLDELQMANAGLARVRELLETRSKLLESSAGSLPRGPLPITFENVSFSYTPERKVLNSLSLRVPAGNVLAVMGRTGCGKSTLARLLLRLYDPHEGQILFGTTPIASVPLQKLRQSVSLVTQDIQFFHASVRDNLTFFDRTIQDATILNVLTQIGLLEWYRSLPEGLNTLLQGSQGLSAGEAQLLALSRAFLKDPQIVILDEASSRLDPITEQKIEFAIDRLLTNRTGIIIAHRLSTLERADQVLLLKDGQIEEQGMLSVLRQDRHSHIAQLFVNQQKEIVA
ncbi:ABC transporter ATP-binding protein [Dictyobacter arantiisoli]|uniref:Helicase n=1 Tax=Dictyobacter arantiisoli TaxID=2014874 RepID=A0A5A5T789_9CHLR|nr:ABC transporter ATP-binding protein [Dictyobacter arantiisoli]GCF07267.1 helicase [Dictyobacter arantiisoli]